MQLLQCIKNNKDGQSLLELILALAIFSLIAVAMITMANGGFVALEQGGEQTEAENLAQEGIEAVRSIHDRAWNELTHNQSGVSASSSSWNFLGEGTTETIGEYTRTISFEDVCRDVSDDIITCPGSYTDLQSKQVTSSVSWVTGTGAINTVDQISYLTNWDSREWTQIDWIGGSGQSTWLDTTKYSSDDGNIDYGTVGEIKLESIGGGGCGVKIWPFTSSSNYTYNSSDIMVSGGTAQLFGATSSIWWDSDYAYRKEITITNVGSSILTNFPAYLSVANEAGMQADYDDLRFVDGACAGAGTELDYEIENSDVSSADVWVEIPSLSTGTDKICMYYGNVSVGTGENSTGVWDANFQFVWHLSDTGSTIIDSTSNSFGGTASGMANISGQIANAKDNPGGASGIISGNSWNLGTGDFTFEGWFNADNVPGGGTWYGTFGTKHPTQTYNNIHWPYDGGWHYWTDNLDKSTGVAVTADTWIHLTATRDSSDVIRYYINGVERFGGGDTDSTDLGNQVVWVGGSATYPWDGGNDELRGSSIARSDDWVEQTYELTANQGTYVSFGSEDPYTSGYPTDEPPIYPTSAHTVSGVDLWTSFSEIATKNGTSEIYYQLSSNGGSTWQYWNGATWTTAGATNYNTASIVNTNISSFATTSASIMFKAFLESDGTDQVQLDEVSISCAQYYDWPFTTPGNYTYDSGDIEVTGGVAQLVASGGGGIVGIENATVSSYEFDTADGRETDFMHISGNIYVIASRDSSADGFLDTIEIDTNGSITPSVIDSLEFDTAQGRYPDLLHISGDVYAVAYSGNGNDGFLKTVEIDTSGNITNTVIDTLEFDTGQALFPDIVHISGNFYAIAYQGPRNDGWLKTVEIDTSGNITNSTVDSWEYDTGNGREPSMINVSGTTFAIVSRGGGGDGFVDTITISSSGVITKSIIDTLEYDTAYGGLPNIINISGDIYAIVYRGNGDDGWLKTIDIDSSGNITNTVVDSLEFDSADGRYAEIINATGDFYLIVYRGVNSDGFVSLVDIDTSGNVGSVIDTLEYDTSAGNYPNIIHVGGNFYSIAYQGAGSDGWVKTIELEVSAPSYPTDEPSINPTSAYSIANLDLYSSFTETATKNGTSEVYYQLSNDGGATWQYWTGSAWAITGTVNYNTASIVNTNISSFATTSASIMFKAFLESNGTDQIQLSNIRIGWGESGGGGGGYETSGYIISSAFDMSDVAPVQLIGWTEIVPAVSDIQVQLRTAPDSFGSPGTWTSWYGASGASSYFVNPTGTLISTDLNGNQWVQYRVELSGNGTVTPVLSEIWVNYK